MKKFLNTVSTRVHQALHNDKGMEVIQFLAIALVSIAIAGLIAGFATGAIETAITNVGNQINGLFPAPTP